MILRNLFRRIVDHDCTEVAGEIAFDFSFSIFPAALFTATLIGLVGITPEFVSKMLDLLGVFLHVMVRQMVENNIRHLVESSSKNLLTVSFVGALWAASSAISGSIKGLNSAYGVEETRSLLYRRTLSVGLTFGVGLAMVVAFILLILGTWIEQFLLVRLRLEQVVPTVVSFFKWPVGFLSGMALAGLLYRIAPNCKRA